MGLCGRIGVLLTSNLRIKRVVLSCGTNTQGWNFQVPQSWLSREIDAHTPSQCDAHACSRPRSALIVFEYVISQR